MSGEWRWSRSAGTGAVSSRPSPTWTWCCCTRRRPRPRTRGCSLSGCGTRSGTRRSGWITPCDRSAARGRSPAADLPALLGMLDLRHIAGDPELAVTLHRRVLADWRADARTRLPALLASCHERADRSGELAFATTPDLKESKGGLRDLVVMRAVAASWVADCPHQGLEEARSALLDVRDALHNLTGRPTDRLQVQDQDSVAQLLQLDDRDMLLRHVIVHRPDGGPRKRPDLAPRAARAALRDRHGDRPRRPVRPPDRTIAARRRHRRAGRRGRPRARHQSRDGPDAHAARGRGSGAGRAARVARDRAAAGEGVPSAARAVAADGAQRVPRAARVGRGDDPRLGGPGPGRADLHAAAGLGAAAVDAAAGPDPPVHRRPAPHADGGERVRAGPPGVPAGPAAAGRDLPRHRQGPRGDWRGEAPEPLSGGCRHARAVAAADGGAARRRGGGRDARPAPPAAGRRGGPPGPGRPENH